LTDLSGLEVLRAPMFDAQGNERADFCTLMTYVNPEALGLLAVNDASAVNNL